MALDAGLPDHGLKRVPAHLTKAGTNKRSSEEEGDSSRKSNRRDTTNTSDKDFNADGLTLKQRLAKVCSNYNLGNCSRRCSRAHVCSYPLPSGKLCGQSHPMVDNH